MGIRHLSLAIPRVAPLCDGLAAEVVHLVGWIRVGVGVGVWVWVWVGVGVGVGVGVRVGLGVGVG